MKTINTTPAVLKYSLLLLLLFSVTARSQEICATVSHNEKLRATNPQLDSIFHSHERVLSQERLTNTVIKIPVVFHVVYNTQSQQPPYEKFYEAIDILTKDFRRQNSDASSTGLYGGYQDPTGLWPFNYSNIAADCEIEFNLCDVTYDYTPFNSVDMIQNPLYFKNTYPYHNSYNPAKYLNVWVGSLSDNVLGVADFPGAPPQIDGVTVTYKSIGNGNPDFRTLTHEVGHWLGLKHIWGDCICCDDFVTDTYPQQANNSVMKNQPPFPGLPNQPPCAMWTACPGVNVYGLYYYPYVNMGDNFMDYSPSSCMNFFSHGQKQRMWYFITNFRPALMNSNSCVTGLNNSYPVHKTLKIHPNPASEIIVVSALTVGMAIEITNVLGIKVLEQPASSSTVEIDISYLPKGVYFLNRTRFIKD